MRRRLPPLNQLRAFEAAARHNSFTKAAAEMHLTQGAISRQVKALEDYLGFELFIRTATGVDMTPEARRYGSRLTKALDGIATATAELTATRSHSVITIRGFTTFFVRWLVPRLPEFERLHPDIEVRLIGSSDRVDFQRDPIDLGVLYGNGGWPGLAADLLFVDELVPVCSAQLATGLPPLTTPADLARHTLLHHSQRPRDWPDWLQLAEFPDVQGASARTFKDLSIAYECMSAGMGLVMGQRAYLQEQLASGMLVAPFETVLRRGAGYYMACRQDSADQEKIVVFRAWLRSACGQAAIAQKVS